MKTITRRNNWRTLSDSEIGKLLPWMKIVHRQRMTTAVLLLLSITVLELLAVVQHVIDGQWEEFLKIIWVYILGGFLIFAAVYSIIEYTSKMRKFKNGEFQVVNVTVSSKTISCGYRSHYYAVRINGLFEEDKNIEKKFRVPKIMYDFVSVGDRAFAVKYNGKDNKKELSDLDFLPSAAD